MGIPSFTQGYPLDASSLGQTKTTIRNNLDGTFQTLAVDHVDNNMQPGGNPPGYHKIIHYVAQDPAPAPNGYGQLYTVVTSSGGNPDQTLFWKSSAGRTLQLSNNIAGVGDSYAPIQNGWTSIPGGLVVQWGRVNTTSSSGRVTYAIPFSANVWSVNTTAKLNSTEDIPGSQANYAPDTNPDTFTITGFNWRLISNSSDWRGFFWYAIGV